MIADIATIVSATLGSEERAQQAEKRAALAEERARKAEERARGLVERMGRQTRWLMAAERRAEHTDELLRQATEYAHDAFHIAEDIDESRSHLTVPVLLDGKWCRSSLATRVRNLMVRIIKLDMPEGEGASGSTESGSASDGTGSAAP